jgi:hypothetical protein
MSVYLREDAVIGEVDGWIAHEFAPHRLNETIHDLVAVPLRRAATLTSEDEEPPRKSPRATGSWSATAEPSTPGPIPGLSPRGSPETEAEKAPKIRVSPRWRLATLLPAREPC